LPRPFVSENFKFNLFVWHCLRDFAFRCFDTIPACDAWMDGQTAVDDQTNT